MRYESGISILIKNWPTNATADNCGGGASSQPLGGDWLAPGPRPSPAQPISGPAWVVASALEAERSWPAN